LHNASAVGLKHIARLVACGLRARTMPVTRHVTYKFVDDTSGFVFQPAPSEVFEVGEDPWLVIPPSSRAFSKFVAEKSDKRAKRSGAAIDEEAQRHCTLSCHDGFAEIQRLRNEAHLRANTSSGAADTKSAKAADGDKLKALFGKRPAEITAEPADAPDGSANAAAEKRHSYKHRNVWKRAKTFGEDSQVMTVRLGDFELMTIHPNEAREALCFPCNAASVSAVVDYLRARNHAGCFEPKAYQKSGRYVGKKRGKNDEPSAESEAGDDEGDDEADSAAQLEPEA
jgi:hypothetical protein